METEAPATSARTKRPHPILLVLLGLAVAALLVTWLRGAAGPAGSPSYTPGAQPRAASPGATIDPSMLDVRLEALAHGRPDPADTDRNPFRFQPRPPPPAPPRAAGPSNGEGVPAAGVAPAPPPPRPITVRYIGHLERQGGTRMAVFVDCSVGRRTAQAQEGGIVDGRYRLVKIGLESVVIEHLDGSGRTTLAQTGQECAGK